MGRRPQKNGEEIKSGARRVTSALKSKAERASVVSKRAGVCERTLRRWKTAEKLGKRCVSDAPRLAAQMSVVGYVIRVLHRFSKRGKCLNGKAVHRRVIGSTEVIAYITENGDAVKENGGEALPSEWIPSATTCRKLFALIPKKVDDLRRGSVAYFKLPKPSKKPKKL